MLGSLCAFCVAAGSAYGTFYLRGSFMASGTSMPGAIFILFLLTLFRNPFIKLIHSGASLCRRELLLVYIMMVMASPIPHLFIWRLLCSLTYPFYYATPENEWRELILPNLPEWMMPHGPQSARLFYRRDRRPPADSVGGLGADLPGLVALYLGAILGDDRRDGSPAVTMDCQ